jgi:hypothetical protein
MELLRGILSDAIRIPLSAFAGLHPFWSLIPISVLSGCAFLWVFGRVSNQERIRDTKRRLAARLYELRLFADEPKLIWQAQAGLLRDNLSYLAFMLLPAAVVTLPMVLLLSQLDAFYGYSPLHPREAADVTVQLKEGRALSGSAPALEASEGFVVETPPVRVLENQQLSWRVRPLRASSGTLLVKLDGASVEKSILAGTAPRYLSKRRVSSFPDLIRHPAEPAVETPAVAWIEVGYRPAEIAGLHWLVWFAIISMGTAVVLRKPFQVTF